MIPHTLLAAFALALVASAQPPAPATKPQQPAAPATAEPAAPTPPAAPANPAVEPADRKDEWWVKRHESFNARTAQGAEKGDIDIMFFGDSITQGWEGEGKDVWAKTFAPRRAVNCGIGGDRTQHVIWRILNGNVKGLDHPKAGAAPRLAIVMIGTNNSGSDSAEAIAAGVGGVVKTLREKLPSAKVLLLAVFPREEKPGALREKLTAVNKLIAPLADNKNVHFLDIGPKLTESDGTISKDIMPDFLHLSPKGYQLWADAIEPKVKELLAEK